MVRKEREPYDWMLALANRAKRMEEALDGGMDRAKELLREWENFTRGHLKLPLI